MSLNDLRNEFGTDIAKIAEELNNSLPMSKPQLRKAFTDTQLKDIHKMIKEVNEATASNEKITTIANNAKTAFNLLKKLGVGL